MQDTPDGFKTAEMACTCVFTVVLLIIGLAFAIGLLLRH